MKVDLSAILAQAFELERQPATWQSTCQLKHVTNVCNISILCLVLLELDRSDCHFDLNTQFNFVIFIDVDVVKLF